MKNRFSLENMNPLDVHISYFEGYWTKNPETINLIDWLKEDSLKDELFKIRQIEEKKERDEIKKYLPAVTVSGIFTSGEKDSLVNHSGLIAIDIDPKDNPHITDYEKAKLELAKIPYVAYCGASASGRGLYAIIPILYPDHHEEHFDALALNFKEININVDMSCRNINRLRFYSWDDNPYYNFTAIAYPHLIERRERTVADKFVPHFTRTQYQNDSGKTAIQVENCIDTIIDRQFDITSSYQDWVKIGFAFASEFAENGRDYFHSVSKFHPGYSPAETDAQYTNCLKHNNYSITMGSFFHLCKQYQIIPFGI